MPARRAISTTTAAVAVTLLGAAFLVAPSARAAQAPVGLGTADSFAVLAGSGITNTGPTTVTGDVGTFPTPTETGFGSLTLHGTNHGGDAVTRGAKDDLVAAYGDAAGRGPVTAVPVELGGSTLRAGVYRAPTLGLTGVLSLDAEGDPDAQFVFQAASTLIAEASSRVVLLNGVNPCRVVWQVGSSATFKTGTQFVGDVLAHTSITAQTRATFLGRLLASNGAVTLDTNTITRSSCTAAAIVGTTPTTSATGTGVGSGSGATAASAPPGTTGTAAGATTDTVDTVDTPTATGTAAQALGTPTAAGGAAGRATASGASTAAWDQHSPGNATSAGSSSLTARRTARTGSVTALAATGSDAVEHVALALLVLVLGAAAFVVGRRTGAPPMPAGG